MAKLMNTLEKVNYNAKTGDIIAYNDMIFVVTNTFEITDTSPNGVFLKKQSDGSLSSPTYGNLEKLGAVFIKRQ